MEVSGVVKMKPYMSHVGRQNAQIPDFKHRNNQTLRNAIKEATATGAGTSLRMAAA